MKARFIVLTAVLCAALGIGTALLVRHARTTPVAAPMPTETPSPTAPPDEFDRILITAAGDCTLGTDADFAYGSSFPAQFEAVGGDYSYFFSNVYDIFAADDITFVNFEGTLTEATALQEKAYNFKGKADYAKILTAGSIEVVSLANNHSYDYLQQGLDDTKAALEAENIEYAVRSKTALLTAKGIKVGFAAFEIWYDDGEVRQNIKNAVEELRESGADLVFVSTHWGIEGKNTIYDVQQAIGHYAIDCGADGVLGHHPHVIQGIETYRGKKIVYSMGNFCFGGNHNPTDKDCFIYQMSFETKNGELTGDWDSEIIPCRISSTDSRNDYCPTPAEGAEKTRILQRIETYSASF